VVFRECDIDECRPIHRCPLAINDLRRAADERNQMKKKITIRQVKQMICDNRNYICCPVNMGSFKAIGLGLKMEGIVYAINSSAVQIRTREFETPASNLQAYFWKVEDCFPPYKINLIDGGGIHGDDDINNNIQNAEVEHKVEESPFDKITTFLLPPTVTTRSLRCLSVWEEDREVGFGMLHFEQ